MAEKTSQGSTVAKKTSEGSALVERRTGFVETGLDYIGWTQWGQQSADLGDIESERTGRSLMIAAIKLALCGTQSVAENYRCCCSQVRLETSPLRMSFLFPTERFLGTRSPLRPLPLGMP